MVYKKLNGIDFFRIINSEKKAREWIWKTRFGEPGFRCSACGEEKYYALETRPEVRTCKRCLKQLRLRAGTIFEASKLPLLIWLRAIQLLMQGKRGISALELKRVLKLKSYDTTWKILHKIRVALKNRDERYRLKGLVELDWDLLWKKEERKSKACPGRH